MDGADEVWFYLALTLLLMFACGILWFMFH
jgi:hypothetical protein